MKILNIFRFLKNSGDDNSQLYVKKNISLFLSIITFFTFLPTVNNAQTWLGDYQYRRALTVNNTGAATLTDYQVKIQLTSSNFNNNFPQANGADIRITAADGTTLLPLWIENWSSNQGVIWSKIPSLPVGNTTIYIYYGDNSVTSASNGTSTFELFEDDWIINPVHTTMQPSWEHAVTYPMIFKEPDSTNYYMIWDGHHDSGTAKGFSTSTDLINWTPYANNPIMGFDSSGVDHGGNGIFAWGDAIKIGSTYHIFPSKGPGFTYHAKSADLITWTGMSGGAAFDSLISDISIGITTGVAILKEGDGITPVTVNGRYWMVYGYSDFYMAWSTDLINWHDANNGSPILNGVSAQWDSVMWTPSFVKIGSTYYIYYQGSAAGVSPWYIGFASAPASGAPNIVTWTKSANNPVLAGNNGWEIGNVAIDPAFRFFDGTYYLFYTGGANNGFATSSNPEGPWSQNNSWVKNHNNYSPESAISNVSGGVIHIGSAQSVQTLSTFSIGHAVGYRAYFNNPVQGYKFGGFINSAYAPYVVYQIDNGFPDNLTFIANFDQGYQRITKIIDPSYLSAYHNFEVTWSDSLGEAYIDHAFMTDITASIPLGPLPVNFENLNNTNTTFDVDWVYVRKFNSPDATVPTVGPETGKPLLVNVKVFLEGPYSGAGAMTTTLNTNTLIPLNSNTAYSTVTYSYTGSTVGSIPNATIVDWVLVELRTGTAAGTKVATRAAFLKSDGTIVDVDGTSPVLFSGLSDGNYYVVVRHRNHLAIMSASGIALNGVTSTLYDFSTLQSQAYTSGTDPMVALTGGGFGMIAADANNSAIITAADVTPIITNLNNSVYNGADVNMSAIVTAADVNQIISNLNKATNVPN